MQEIVRDDESIDLREKNVEVIAIYPTFGCQEENVAIERISIELRNSGLPNVYNEFAIAGNFENMTHTGWFTDSRRMFSNRPGHSIFIVDENPEKHISKIQHFIDNANTAAAHKIEMASTEFLKRREWIKSIAELVKNLEKELDDERGFDNEKEVFTVYRTKSRKTISTEDSDQEKWIYLLKTSHEIMSERMIRARQEVDENLPDFDTKFVPDF